MDIGFDRVIDTFYVQGPGTYIVSGPYDTEADAEAACGPGEHVLNIAAV